MSKVYYSVSGYAKEIGTTAMTVYNHIKSGKLDFIEVEIGKTNKKGYVIVVDKMEE